MNSVRVFCLVLLCRLAVSAPVNTVPSSTTPIQSTTGMMSSPNTRLPQSITSQQPTTSQVNLQRDLSGQQSSQQATSPLTNEQIAAQGPMMRSPPAVSLSPEAQARAQNVELMEMFASMLKPRIMGADGAAAEAQQHNQQQQQTQQPDARQTMTVPQQSFGQPQPFVQGQGFVPQQQPFVQQPYGGVQQPMAYAPQQYQQINPYAAQQQQQALQARLLGVPTNQGYGYPAVGALPVQQQYNPAAIYGRSADVSVPQQAQQLPQQQTAFSQQPQSLTNQQVPQQQFQQGAVPQQTVSSLNNPAASNTGFTNPQNFNTGAATNQFPQTSFQG